MFELRLNLRVHIHHMCDICCKIASRKKKSLSNLMQFRLQHNYEKREKKIIYKFMHIWTLPIFVVSYYEECRVKKNYTP